MDNRNMPYDSQGMKPDYDLGYTREWEAIVNIGLLDAPQWLYGGRRQRTADHGGTFVLAFRRDYYTRLFTLPGYEYLPAAAQFYRQRALGYYYASNGIKVVPNLRMGSTDTIPDALRGIEYGSTVAVSTVGAVGDVACTANHVQLLTEAVDKLGVTDVLVYGRLLPGFTDLPCHYHVYPVFYDKFMEGRK